MKIPLTCLKISKKISKAGKEYNIGLFGITVGPFQKKFRFFLPEKLVADILEGKKYEVELYLDSDNFFTPKVEIKALTSIEERDLVN